MKGLSPRISRVLVAFVHDVVMAGLSFVVALYLRLGEQAYDWLSGPLFYPWFLFTTVCVCAFWFTGLYRGIWRYASLNDMIAIARAVTLALLLYLPVTFMITRLEGVPRSMLVINWFVLAALLSGPRLLYRVLKDRGFEHLLERGDTSRVPVLLVGASDAAEVFIREMSRDPHAPYEVLGLIDDKGTRVGRQMRGVRVLGDLNALDEVIDSAARRNRPPQRLVLTRPLPREAMERLLELTEARGMTIARLPRLADLKSGHGDPIEVRPIAVEDLLGRTQTKLDRVAMRRLIEGRRVLVSGAGGTIGAELVRQVAAQKPSELILLDYSEHLLYAAELELATGHRELPRRAVLADVREAAGLDEILAEHRPELLFHAAALKHVPMLEANPLEGVLTNVIGTRNIADACRRAGLAGMVLISTDKAVNPTSVMGACKRLAECYCQALDIAERERAAREGEAASRFVTVRFGNVLGSAGSVVPLFQRQLAAGGPLTVTDPRMTRYFMTVHEAVELVLQASALGLGTSSDLAGKIYVLDMGEPVKIVDLARQMIRLAGLQPDKDVEIVFTGVRPGEKLAEELFHAGEPVAATDHPGLLLATPRVLNLELLSRGLTELHELAAARKRDEAVALLSRLVPEYRPDVATGSVTTARGRSAAAS
jgi:O-antigen biosynthesis protein WbqV